MDDTKYIKDESTIVEERVVRKVYDIDKLTAELKEIEERIKRLEQEPDEILVPNDEKFNELALLAERKEEINKIMETVG